MADLEAGFLALDIGVEGEAVAEGEPGIVLLDGLVALEGVAILLLLVVDHRLLEEGAGSDLGIAVGLAYGVLECGEGVFVFLKVYVAVAEKDLGVGVEHLVF